MLTRQLKSHLFIAICRRRSRIANRFVNILQRFPFWRMHNEQPLVSAKCREIFISIFNIFILEIYEFILAVAMALSNDLIMKFCINSSQKWSQSTSNVRSLFIRPLAEHQWQMLLANSTMSELCAYLSWQNARCTTCPIDNHAECLEFDVLFAFGSANIYRLRPAAATPFHNKLRSSFSSSPLCCASNSFPHKNNNSKEDSEVMAFIPLSSISLYSWTFLFVCKNGKYAK